MVTLKRESIAIGQSGDGVNRYWSVILERESIAIGQSGEGGNRYWSVSLERESIAIGQSGEGGNHFDDFPDSMYKGIVLAGASYVYILLSGTPIYLIAAYNEFHLS